VVKAPFGYILADGHHKVMASIANGGLSVPCRLMDDLSSSTNFWKEAEARGYAYLVDIDGNRVDAPPASFDALVDDPNRYFAAITARKIVGGVAKGPNNFLWIKKEDAPPFIEFKIADILYAHHFRYTYAMGSPPPPTVVEEAREILAGRV
jgi:hypothetical protein